MPAALQLPYPSILRGIVFFCHMLHNEFMSNILQNIFKEHYNDIIFSLKPRQSVVENVRRMINCGDPCFGGAMYGCTDCGTLKFFPFRCHSRFCPTCGNKYSIDRTTSMSFKIINVQHRHCVFTIDSSLRKYFLEDRSLLSCLFKAVKTTILYLFHKDNKAELFTPGFICVLHTFGRDLKWNPHIHCLISEGGLGKSGIWRPKNHFNYTFLRNVFRTVLLNILEKHIGPSFKKQKSYCYKEHPNGFYVYAKPNKCDPKVVTKYIGRYLGRPVIATSRIDAYDGDYVTFHYNRHEDNKLIVEKVPVMNFIERLIQHIPEKNFKQIRYYGLYAKPKRCTSNLRHCISAEKQSIFRSFNRWRSSILSSFGYDPIKCPCCKATMKVLEVYYDHQQISLDELYERAKVKHLARSLAC